MGSIRSVSSATVLAALLGLACTPFRGLPHHDAGPDGVDATDSSMPDDANSPDLGKDQISEASSLDVPSIEAMEPPPADGGPFETPTDAIADSASVDAALGEVSSQLELPKTGLEVELEADYGLVTTTDDLVSKWRDESGNGFDAMVDVGFEPAFFPDVNAGAGAILLGSTPGASLSLPSGFSDLQGGSSTFFVFSLQKRTGITQLFNIGPNGPLLVLTADADMDVVSFGYHVGPGATTGGRAFAFTYGVWHLVEVVQRGGSVGGTSTFTVYLDGTALVTASQPVPSTEVKTPEVGPVIDQGYLFLQAALIYSRPVSNDERAQIEKYLMSKWGIE
jgi:hypothetical protein